jgi:uncharacterized OB-fold protein
MLVGLSFSSYHTTRNISEQLLSNYTNYIRPRINQSDLVDISVQPYIYAILKFDEAQGVFSWHGTFMIAWMDDFNKWNANANDDLFTLNLPAKQVWIPKILIKNANKRTFFSFDNDFDYMTTIVKYKYNGSAHVEVGGIIETTCEAQMLYYPADRQVCSLQLYVEDDGIRFVEISGYTVYPSYTEWFEQNSEWEMLNMTSTIHNSRYLQFDMYIKRKPLFLCITLVLPIILVSIVNLFVFILPIGSGERTSFSVTLFLTFVIVAMTVADSLPHGNQMSIFSSILVIRLVVSSLTTIMAIVTISFHYDDGRNSQSVVLNIMVKLCKKRLFNHEHNVDDTYNPNSDSDVQPTTREWPDKKERKIDYIRYAATIDNICISVLVTEMVIEFITVFIMFVKR